MRIHPKRKLGVQPNNTSNKKSTPIEIIASKTKNIMGGQK